MYRIKRNLTVFHKQKIYHLQKRFLFVFWCTVNSYWKEEEALENLKFLNNKNEST